MLNELAERYVILVLALGKLDSDYVDSYFGPASFREKADGSSFDLSALLDAAENIAAAVEDTIVTTEEEALRQDFLLVHARSLCFRIKMLRGDVTAFDEEARELYGMSVPERSQDYYEELIQEIEPLLPGSGPIHERYRLFRETLIVPPERIERVLTLAIEAARSRTAAGIDLPPDESFSLELVSGQPWGAYNWYQGRFHSLIQFNTSLPAYIDRLVDLACHEGYPGHHVFHSIRERELVEHRSWHEFSVVPLFSPQALISEGAATIAAEIVFPDPVRESLDQEVFYPAAGLDAELAPKVARIAPLLDKLASASCDAARAYLNGNMPEEAVVDWLMRYSLLRRDQAEQRLRFIQKYRSYVATYSVGAALARDFLERFEGEHDRWEIYQKFIGLPLSPQLLLGNNGSAAAKALMAAFG
jgi:hypothetical protein